MFQTAIEWELDKPEKVWKSYIDFETGLGEFDKAWTIYDMLLEKSKHVKVWLSKARFEIENC